MRAAFLSLLMILVLAASAQKPKIYEKKHKKEGYTEYKISLQMGGNVKTEQFVNTMKLDFSYDKHWDGKTNKGQLFFMQQGYNNGEEALPDGKKTIGLVLLVGEDTIPFKSTYWSVDRWTTNGVPSDRPDRYMNFSFFDLDDAMIDKILNAGTVKILRFGTFENEDAPWFFTEENRKAMKYMMEYVKTDPD